MFWKIFYNIILYPIIFFALLIMSFFNKKIKEGFLGRLKSIKELKTFMNNIDTHNDIYWFHAASLGEYEQIKPVLAGLKEVEPSSKSIVSFFSPSGFNYVDDLNIDCKVYLPFDFYWTINKCLKIIKPKKLILAAYDVWPNLIWIAKSLDIQTTLFAARFSSKSSKTFPLIKFFYRNIYNSFTAIYTITKKDRDQLKVIIGDADGPILRTLGNPRYDQVKLKSDKFTKERTKSVLQRPKRLVLGSMHHEDEKRLNSSIFELLSDFPHLSLIWAPHSPSKKNILRIC